MQRIVLHYDADPGLRQRLDQACAGRFAIETVPPEDGARLGQCLETADVLWHVLARADAGLIASAPRLRLIQKIGVGVNTIDLDAARAREIAVCNMPGTNTAAVAEMTLALMLACLRVVPLSDRLIREGGGLAPALRALNAPGVARPGEIAGRTVGFVGYGAVPRRLTPALRALGAEVIFWNRTPRPDALARACDWPTLLAQADILSLHLPATPDTTRIIDARAIALMKTDAILINTARGELVDEPALAGALADGRLASAGLDTFAAEPAGPSPALIAAPNTVFSPHIAWTSEETFERSIGVALENARRLESGEALLFRVA